VGRYLAVRLAWAVVMLLGVAAITFALAFVVPGDPAAAIAGPRASAETIAAIRQELGLNDPLPVQFGRYLGRTLRGDFGRSYVTGEDVFRAVRGRLPATALLAVTAWLCWLVVGTAIGLGGALRPGRWGERVVLCFAIVGSSLPTFWVGLVLLYLFASRLRWLPDAGYETPAHLVLPVATLTVSGAAYYARLVQSSMLEVLQQEYIRTARAKGLAPRQVLLRHALRNALLPLVTIAGADLAALLSGVVFTEKVFAWPGIGQLAVQSVTNLDLPMILGTVLFSATLVVLANLAVDLAYPLLDPRIRL
jgi:peptide/nickel transport system permease protein